MEVSDTLEQCPTALDLKLESIDKSIADGVDPNRYLYGWRAAKHTMKATGLTIVECPIRTSMTHLRLAITHPAECIEKLTQVPGDDIEDTELLFGAIEAREAMLVYTINRQSRNTGAVRNSTARPDLSSIDKKKKKERNVVIFQSFYRSLQLRT